MRRWRAPFQKVEMSPRSPGGAGFLLFGGRRVGGIFNVFVKHVSLAHCYFQLKAYGRVGLGATWPA